MAQEPPPTIQMLVAEDNSRMDEWTKQVQQIRVRNIYMYTSLVILTISEFRFARTKPKRCKESYDFCSFVDFSML